MLVPAPDYFNGNISELRSYASTYLAYQGALPLPQYLEQTASGTTPYPAEGRFVFVSRGGTNVYVLIRGKAPYEDRFKTGLATYRSRDIP